MHCGIVACIWYIHIYICTVVAYIWYIYALYQGSHTNILQAPVLLTASEDEQQAFIDNMWHPEVTHRLHELGSTRQEIEEQLKMNLARLHRYLQAKVRLFFYVFFFAVSLCCG